MGRCGLLSNPSSPRNGPPATRSRSTRHHTNATSVMAVLKSSTCSSSILDISMGIGYSVPIVVNSSIHQERSFYSENTLEANTLKSRTMMHSFRHLLYQKTNLSISLAGTVPFTHRRSSHPLPRTKYTEPRLHSPITRDSDSPSGASESDSEGWLSALLSLFLFVSSLCFVFSSGRRTQSMQMILYVFASCMYEITLR